MIELKGSQRRHLRSLAHSLDPAVRVGKNGITDDLISSVDEALEAHELIKVKFMDFKEDKKELSQIISIRSKSHLIGMIGNIAIFYRQNPDKDKRKIFIPGS